MGDDEKKSSNAAFGPAFVLFILNIIIIKSGSLDQFELIGLGDRWKFHHFMMWCAVGVMVAALAMMWLACVTMVSENESMAMITTMVAGLCTLGLLTVVVLQYYKMGQLWHDDPHHTIFFYDDFWHEGVAETTYNNTLQSTVPLTYTLNTTSTAARQLTLLAASATIPNLRTAVITTSDFKMTDYPAAMSLTVQIRRRLNYLASSSHRHLETVKRNLNAMSRHLTSEQITPLASKWVYTMSDVVIRIYGFGLMFLPFIMGVGLCMGGTAWGCGKCCSSK
jgi:hypothetical protein